MTRFASSLSTRSDSAAAEREALDGLAAGLDGAAPDLLLAFVSHHHGGALEGLGQRLRAASGARTLLGCTGESIVGASREVERGPGLALWALSSPDLVVRPFHAAGVQTGDEEIDFTETPTVGAPERTCLLLFGEPFSFPMAEYLRLLEDVCPGVPALGGMASGGRGPGQNLLFLDDEVVASGAIGAALEGGVQLVPVVSQGCRPVGKPWVITAARDQVVQKLGGKPAAKVLMETLHELAPADRELFQRMAFLGLALDPRKSRFERGDFLVRGIRGLSAEDGSMLVADDSIRRGMTVQFMVRDAASAGEDLEQLLATRLDGVPAGAAGALVFSCNGRGRHMFEEADHDIRRVQGAFAAPVPAAGFFAMGEIGPVGGQNFLHGYTASVALFEEPGPPAEGS